MFANNIPAQYYRYDFAFTKWSDFSMPDWKRVRAQADQQMIDFDFEIWGFRYFRASNQNCSREYK